MKKSFVNTVERITLFTGFTVQLISLLFRFMLDFNIINYERNKYLCDKVILLSGGVGPLLWIFYFFLTAINFKDLKTYAVKVLYMIIILIMFCHGMMEFYD